MRDYRKLEVYQLAEDLLVDLYQMTVAYPVEERYGLQSQVRRAGVSVVTNVAEGSARRSGVEYCRFLEVAFGSAREVEVVLRVSLRLGMLDRGAATALAGRYSAVQGMLANIIKAIRPEP
jgi:four helix bundle protein